MGQGQINPHAARCVYNWFGGNSLMGPRVSTSYSHVIDVNDAFCKVDAATAVSDSGTVIFASRGNADVLAGIVLWDSTRGLRAVPISYTYQMPEAMVATAISSDGQKIAICHLENHTYTPKLYLSKDGGVTVSVIGDNDCASELVMSSDGNTIAYVGKEAITLRPTIKFSRNTGQSWSSVRPEGLTWSGLAMGQSGSQLIFGVVTQQGLYLSNDTGKFWKKSVLPNGLIPSQVSFSEDGKVMAAIQSGQVDYSYLSIDQGASWTAQTSSGQDTWGLVKVSGSGNQVAISSNSTTHPTLPVLVASTAPIFFQRQFSTFPNTGLLSANSQLLAGQGIRSPNGQYALWHQTDGNVVIFSAVAPIWSTGTVGSTSSFAMQGDGNLVLYPTNGTPLWASNTAGNSGAKLVLQDDGNLVIYSGNGQVLWSIR